MKNKFTIKQRIKAGFILLVSGSLLSESEITKAANEHFKPLGGDNWTHNNSFKEGVRYACEKITGNDR